ncbi:heme exporter protein CcmD [Terrihabitans rhizophilus]|uniref:Heme exporter protein D n=1 Tax=Terrihabitans rhizophilus TaxID=3092662 RepID=A0ABU4RPF7_9HYPH|nr:heme exporter protein CcmD [Terrihabitans sp. PJ23]MDX6806073.1 heme exporter protein CcmD [Terrihabitans sp. PJ23]
MTHAGFIVAAYLFTGAVLTALVVWSVVEHRRQRSALAKLEARLGRSDAE